MKPQKQHDYWKEWSVQLRNWEIILLIIAAWLNLNTLIFFSFISRPTKKKGIYSKDQKKNESNEKEFLQKQEFVYEIEVRNDTGTNCKRNVDETVLISMESEWKNRWSSMRCNGRTHMVIWSKQNQNASFPKKKKRRPIHMVLIEWCVASKNIHHHFSLLNDRRADRRELRMEKTKKTPQNKNKWSVWIVCVCACDSVAVPPPIIIIIIHVIKL